MAWSVTRVGTRTGTTTVTSFNITTTAAIPAGDLIVVSVTAANVGDTNDLSSVTDSAGNSYVSGGFTVDPGQNTLTAVWYCANCKALASSSTVTVTFTSSVLTFGQFQGAAVDDVSGAATATPVDQHNGHNSQTAGTWDTNSITTVNASDLLWVADGVNQGGTVAVVQGDCLPASGWTIQTALASGNSSLDTAYQAVSATGTYKGGGTSGAGNNGNSAVIVAFKAASGGSTPVTLSDSGTGSDSLSVQATVPLSDSGTGADSLSITATVPLADAGSGADALAVTATVPLTDSGAGADSLSTAVTVTYTDSGTGADTLSSLNVTLGLTENGAGTDNLSSVLVSLALTDSGTGADSITLGNPIAFSDAGAGAETFSLAPVTITLTDSGTGNDGAFTLAPITFTLADSGTGANALIVGGATVPGSCAVSDSAVGVVVVSDSAVGVVVVSDSPAEVS